MSCVTWCQYDGPLPEKDDPDSNLFEWEIELATLSNWARNNLLQAFEADPTGTPITIPTQFYVAVHSTVCSAATAGTELNGDGYTQRTPISFDRVSDILRWNPISVTTAAPTAAWTVRSFSLWDNATIGGGNYWAFGNLTQDETIDKPIIWQANRVLVGLGFIP